MFDKIKDLFIINIEREADNFIEIEKSINDNKRQALDLAKGFSPLISSLEKNMETMKEYCDIEKSITKKAEGLIMVERIADKLLTAKNEYYKEIGELRKSNQQLESKLTHLSNDKDIMSIVGEIKKNNSLDDSFLHITDNFKKGLIPKELFLKAVSNYSESKNKKEMIDIKKSIFGEYGNKAIEKIKELLKGKTKESAKEKKIAFVMKEFEEGKLLSSSGEVVTDKDQALAIAYSYFKSEDIDVEKSYKTIYEAYLKNEVGEDLMIKVQEKYFDKSENKKIKDKVSDKDFEETEDKEVETKTEENPLDEYAKNASGSALEQASKESKDSGIREAAHKELDRREKEEKPKIEDEKTKEDDVETVKEVSDKKEDSDKKQVKKSIENDITNFREFPTNNYERWL